MGLRIVRPSYISTSHKNSYILLSPPFLWSMQTFSLNLVDSALPVPHSTHPHELSLWSARALVIHLVSAFYSAPCNIEHGSPWRIYLSPAVSVIQTALSVIIAELQSPGSIWQFRRACFSTSTRRVAPRMKAQKNAIPLLYFSVKFVEVFPRSHREQPLQDLQTR